MNKQWLKLVLFALILALVLVIAPNSRQASALSSGVVISQVYGGGGATGGTPTYVYDYIELFNRGSSPVSLNGWSVQYGSSTGSSFSGMTLLPNVSLAPGQYYMIQQGSAGTVGAAFPITPDLTGTLNMSASAGKVALMSNATLISVGCPTAGVVDLVGYGTATNCSETSPTTPNLNNTLAALRGSNGCTETDVNSADFSNGTPNPRNTASTFNVCPTGDIAPTVTSTTPADNATGVVANTNVTITFSEAVNVSGTIAVVGSSSGTQNLTPTTGDNLIFTLDPADFSAGETVTVTVLATQVADQDGTPNNMAADYVFDFTIESPPVITRIHTIQGSGDTVTGSGPFTVEAIVVGDYQTQGSGQLRGFFIQEKDVNADANPATSEGIFVFCSSCPTDVAVGDEVRVTGTASDFNGMSQLSATTASSVTVLSTGNTLPTPASVDLPVPGVPNGDLSVATGVINAYFEAFEGMLVKFSDTLSVSEYFQLARFGQVTLSEGGRPHTFTDANTPTAAGYTDHRISLASRTIILDDTDNRQNRPIDTPNTNYYHPVPGLSTTNYFRGGDTITNLTGVLHWSWPGSGSETWRIRPVTEAFTYAFTPVNTRPTVPAVSGDLTVASFNVLNYFLTIDTVDVCGPAQNQDCRGADSAQEFDRQRTKMLAALTAIDADVFGFNELENTTGVDPLADIVAGLTGYDYIDTGVIGTDTIRVGIIYKSAVVQPVGSYAILDSTVDPNFDSSRNRPALAQTFEEIATGERFTVVVNHLKSKGSSCGTGDDDTTTGQGNCNGTRTAAAGALASWLATDPTGSGDPDFLIIGDLNSYAKEDPIAALETAGYTNLVADIGGPGAYGYVFDGQLGYLDHALANPSMYNQVADLAEWHINADEIPLFDYNDDVKDPGESTFEEESSTQTLYEPNAYRTSDHDPVIIGLNLFTPTPPATFVSTTAAGSVGPLNFGSEDVLKWDGSAWSVWFDGTAAGLAQTGKWRHNLNAIYIPDPNGQELIMSFAQNRRTVPGIPGLVDGMGLVRWDGSAFSLWFDGQDVGLTQLTQEKIDGLHVLDGSLSPVGGSCQAYLLISTQGPGRVNNPGEPSIRFSGEDVLGFCATNLGPNTAGFWTMVLDGSAEGMPRNSTDSISASDDGSVIYLTTRGAFNVDSAVGGHSMVYRYDVGTGTFSGPFFSAPANGLTAKVDALHVQGDLP